MSNPSPPKPWEKAGSGAVGAVSTSRTIPLSSTGVTSSMPSVSTTTSSTTGIPPSLPARPSTLASAVNQTAANYSTFNNPATGMGASPYGYGGGYNNYNSYGGSMYNRFGSGFGTMNSMNSMYGGYGGYRPMYGNGPGMYGGMGMDPNNPSLTQSFSQSTQATFQLIEGLVGAFGGFAQMLESTYMATHSSFFAMVAVAEQFGNLRQTLGSVLGIYTLIRWFRSFFAKITGRPPPASVRDLTPEKFAKFQGRMPDGSPLPQSPSRKPLIMFLIAVFGLPYLMGKLIKALAKGQEEAAARHAEQGETIDISNLEFCRVLYDFSPDTSAGVQGVDLAVKQGDLVAVLSKTDPLGNPSEWWKCRSRDGRMGYLPSPYLELIVRRPATAQITSGSPHVTPAGSRTQTMTTDVTGVAGNSRASTLTGMKVEDIVRQEAAKMPVPVTNVPELKGGPETITPESFQKSMFNNS